MFFVPTPELISRKVGWEALTPGKLGAFPHQCFVSKTGLEIIEIRSPYHFLLPLIISQKTLNFANMKCLEQYLESEQKFENP